MSFNWPAVSFLLVLTAIPAIPTLFIIPIVLMGPELIEGAGSFINALHFNTPAAVVVHGGAGFLFFLTMPFQFSPALRRSNRTRQNFRDNKHRSGWHKIGGRIAFLSAIVMALSGIWMHHVLSPGQFGARYVSLVIMSLSICVSFSLGLFYIIKGQVETHKKWMTRSVAITLAAITPLFTEILLFLLFGQFEQIFAVIGNWHHDYGRLLAIAINLSIAEVLICKKTNREKDFSFSDHQAS
jgi:hypothetical protein